MFEVKTRSISAADWSSSGPIHDKMIATARYAEGVNRMLRGEVSAVQMWRDGTLTVQTVR